VIIVPEFLAIEQVRTDEILHILWKQANAKCILYEADDYLIRLGFTNRLATLRRFPGILAIYLADRKSGKIAAFSTFDLMRAGAETTMAIALPPQLVSGGIVTQTLEYFKAIGYKSILTDQLNNLAQSFNLLAI